MKNLRKAAEVSAERGCVAVVTVRRVFYVNFRDLCGFVDFECVVVKLKLGYVLNLSWRPVYE